MIVNNLGSGTGERWSFQSLFRARGERESYFPNNRHFLVFANPKKIKIPRIQFASWDEAYYPKLELPEEIDIYLHWWEENKGDKFRSLMCLSLPKYLKHA